VIFNRDIRDFQVALFAFDIDEQFFTLFGEEWQTTEGAEGWLLHNKNRLYLRLYTFVDSVLERHFEGKRGFRDPVIIYGNIKEGHFNIHPGTNRVVLKKLLPEVKQIGWVVDPRCNHRNEYSEFFNNIQPLVRNEEGNNRVTWQTHHRTGRGGEDQYDFSLTTDRYVGHADYDTPKRRDEWKKLCRKTGFSCFVNNKYIIDIGIPQSSVDKFDIQNITGIYQLFLHYFFGYDLGRWDKLHFRRRVL